MVGDGEGLSALDIRDRDGGAEIAVRAHPGARKDEVGGLHDGALRVRVTAAPEKGKANKAIAGVLSKTLGAPRGAVSIVSGETSREKRFRIEGMSATAVRTVLGPVLDGSA